LIEVELGPHRLGVASEFGPRLLSLRTDGSPELLARLDSDHAIDSPRGKYRFHGGHRLWAAPEVPDVTYANDDHTCEVKVDGDRIIVIGPPDDAGLVKTIAITFRDGALVVEHTIEGASAQPVAPWAITQFPLGGTAILPLAGGDTGPQPNRSLVLWPYTALNDHRIRFEESVVLVTAHDGSPLKLGTGPDRQSLGYLRDGWLFIKAVESSASGRVPDLGAASQVYVGQGFCELETVGGLVDLNDRPASISERWWVIRCEDETKARHLVVKRAET
jgi:hypothetical protein